MFTVGHVPVHKNRITTASPIRSPEAIARIKELLKDNPRDLALYVLGINSAFRIGDLVALRRIDLMLLPNGRFEILVRELKTRKLRRVMLNQYASSFLNAHLTTSTGVYVFEGERGPLTTSYVRRLIKKWCAEAGLEGNYTGHSLRKTFVRRHIEAGEKLGTLMYVLNHASERQTLAYVGLLSEDVDRVYARAI